MNELIAELAAGWLRARLEPAPAAAGGGYQSQDQAAIDRKITQTGGRVADGFALAPLIATACEEARHVPPRFASSRNKRAEPLPVPGGLHAPPVRTSPRRAAAAGTLAGAAEADAKAFPRAIGHQAQSLAFALRCPATKRSSDLKRYSPDILVTPL